MWKRAAGHRHLLSCLALIQGVPLEAQMVQGRVLDEESRRGTPGAVVLLLDSGGQQRQAVLTSEEGLFRFTVPRPDQYSLRAEMIGRRSVETELFHAVAGEASRHDLVLPASPIRLAGLEVSGETRCRGDLESARSVYLVWSEVAKALRATEVTSGAPSRQFRIAEYDRRRAKNSLEVVEEFVSESDVNGAPAPFVSLPPSDLADRGYIREERGGTWIYGPSTEALLSPEFQETHCLSLERSRSQPGTIGIGFEPVPGRTVPDIRGVLWVDEQSAELRTLEFQFDNVPETLMRGDYEGAAEFRRLDAGDWIIKRWWLRSPDLDNLHQIKERAGELVQPGKPRERSARSAASPPAALDRAERDN